MLKIYETNLQTNKFAETDKIEKGVWINLVNPSEEEIKSICSKLQIEEDFIRYPLDYEEQARIDKEDDENITLFLMDVPVIEVDKDEKTYTTMPLGVIVVKDDYIVTVSLRKNRIIDTFERSKVKGFCTYKKTRFLLQILYLNASCYLDILKKINRQAEATVDLLEKSMKNKELIQLLNLENSLVYITTSLKANELVMEKILKGRIIKMYEEDEDILEDGIIENRQAMEMGKIYSDILSGTMDAYASVISNNLNVVMKFLAAATIVMAIPTLIASLWGMNLINMPFENNQYGFIIISIISVVAAVVAAVWLKKRDMF